MVGNSAARLKTRSRYLVPSEKGKMSEEKIQRAIDILDQCSLALRFYIGTKEEKYLDELTWAIKRLNQLLSKKGSKNE